MPLLKITGVIGNPCNTGTVGFATCRDLCRHPGFQLTNPE